MTCGTCRSRGYLGNSIERIPCPVCRPEEYAGDVQADDLLDAAEAARQLLHKLAGLGPAFVDETYRRRAQEAHEALAGAIYCEKARRAS